MSLALFFPILRCPHHRRESPILLVHYPPPDYENNSEKHRVVCDRVAKNLPLSIFSQDLIRRRGNFRANRHPDSADRSRNLRSLANYDRCRLRPVSKEAQGDFFVSHYRVGPRAKCAAPLCRERVLPTSRSFGRLA